MTYYSDYVDAFGTDGVWNSIEEHDSVIRRIRMTPLQMVREFRETFGQPLDVHLTQEAIADSSSDADEMAMTLIHEEFKEVTDAWDDEVHNGSEPLLKELADLVYVVYGYAAYRGWNLDKALARVHLSNMSKVDPATGTVLKREDGKVLKPESYRPPYLKDLV